MATTETVLDAALDGAVVVNEDTTPADANNASKMVAAAYGRRLLIIFIVQMLYAVRRVFIRWCLLVSRRRRVQKKSSKKIFSQSSSKVESNVEFGLHAMLCYSRWSALTSSLLLYCQTTLYNATPTNLSDGDVLHSAGQTSSADFHAGC